MSETVFSRIRHYEVLDEIGGGGMAQVFLALDTRSGQRVALRRVTSRATDVIDAEQSGAELQTRFWPLCRLVPEVYETFMADGAFVVAMEYIAGEDLSDLIKKGPVAPDRACAIAVSLCRFLEAAKEFRASVNGRQLQHLLHGDLTPGNVRLTDDGLRVLDFGISKALSASRKVTQSDFGNIAYLSPERLESGSMDATDGFWSVGVMLYEMLKGLKPFSADNTRRLEHRITSRRPPDSLDGRCPDGLRAIVAKLLAGTASSRYDDARLIRDDLERFLAGERTVAEQEGWPDVVSDTPATTRTRLAGAYLDEPTRPTPRPEPLPTAEGGTVGATLATSTGRAADVFRQFPVPFGMLVVAGLVASVVLGVNQVRVFGEATRSSSVLQTSDGLADLMKFWGSYTELSGRSYLHLGVGPLERALVARTQVMVDRVIRNYSTGVSGMRETQWKEARAPLLLAVAAAPSDQQLRASLRFIDGHLHRIDGTANGERQQVQAARKEFAEALTAFREAAELRPKWPDPFLGLARTFISGLGDLEKGEDAITQAQRLGHGSIEPEILLLAEGYRKRADTLTANSIRLSGTPQEEELLTRARAAYARSLELYASLPSGGPPDDVRTAQRGLNRAEQRLDRLLPPPDQAGSSDPTTAAGQGAR